MVCLLKAKKCQVFFSIFSIMLWCFCSAYAKQNSIKESTEPFVAFTYKETPMGLYVPNETGKNLPIVMFLHGCNNNPVYSTHWIISTLNAIEPCAVFANSP